MGVRVIALGGSLLSDDSIVFEKWMEGLAEILKKRSDQESKTVLVVGGGAVARNAINVVSKTTRDRDSLDRVGISATRLNATIIREKLLSLGVHVSREEPTSVQDAIRNTGNELLVMGGTEPGHTTDCVAIEIAIGIKAQSCLIATNVSHVYTSDPSTDPNATPISTMSHEDLRVLVGEPKDHKAGGRSVVDPVGAKIARESDLDLDIVDGRDHSAMSNALAGLKFNGTQISVK